MGVKDLVSLYEPSRSTQAPPISARFIRHDGANNSPSASSPSASASPTPTSSLTTNTINDSTTLNDNTDTIDITESFDNTNEESKYPEYDADDDEETLLPHSAPTKFDYTYKYPPASSSTDHATLVQSSSSSYKKGKSSSPSSSSSPHRPRRHRVNSPHTPVPAKTLFARNAAPLYLPKLDNYLSSLPAPIFPPDQLVFPPGSGKGKEKARTARDPKERIMFPPMDRLNGRRIEDLENNKKALNWTDRKSIFGGLTSTVLGITGSSAIALYYSLSGLINTMQIFALILNTLIPINPQALLSDWRQLLLGTIPNILALNFTFAPLIALFTFMSISLILLYHFYRSTSTDTCQRYGKLEGLQFPHAPIPPHTSFISSLFCCGRRRKTKEPKFPIIKDGVSGGNEPHSHWGILITTFILTAIYLPLSTMAIHVLVWSDDLWVVKNPYANLTAATVSTNGSMQEMQLLDSLKSLGPEEEWRHPLDFCWTTSMKRNEVNWAPALVVVSIWVLFLLTIWFPITLHRVIKQSVPKVDPYTQLGRRRNAEEMDKEYVRLLDRDRNPFVFLYKGFRRQWSTYMSIYLFTKLSALLIVAVVNPSNCLFRPSTSSIRAQLGSNITLPVVNLDTTTPDPVISILKTILTSWSTHITHITLTRQILLLCSTILWFAIQCFYAPFLDPVSNASEWVSRANYVVTAVLALVVQAGAGGKFVEEMLEGWGLYAVYVITYGMSFYFTVIGMGVGRRGVKWLTRRIDFSIDIFSPRLDLAMHIKRRIWQESITALLLTNPECAIPKEQKMVFAESKASASVTSVQGEEGDVYPPYLLGFLGTPGERHVENLKILKEVGSLAYKRAVALTCGPDHTLYKNVAEQIQKRFIGPDCYWKPPPPIQGSPVVEKVVWKGDAGAADAEMVGGGIRGCTNYFGNAWWIPFPPTLVIRYDDGPSAYLRDISELEEYVTQNCSRDIQRRKEIRMALRALDGQEVRWPYEHVDYVGAQTTWCCYGKRYSAKSATYFQTGTLRIKHRGHLEWENVQLGSGFNVQLNYSKKIILGGSIIGLNDDYDLTQPLARFLSLNRDLIPPRLHHIERVLASYRRHHYQEIQAKGDVLSYRFLSLVYDRPRDPQGLAESSIEWERDLRVRALMVGSESERVFEGVYERMRVVGDESEQARAWWYVFWDDLWRRNHDSISGLKLHARDFDPHYATSIAYRPLPRPALESFLIQRGLMSGSRKPRWRDFFHHGFLNKVYLRLNECVFRGSNRAIMFHIGNEALELDMSDVDLAVQLDEHRTSRDGQFESTLGTGGGTDHDAESINPRHIYRWEGLLGDSVMRRRHGRPWRKSKNRPRRDLLANLGAWFGVTPLVKDIVPTRGVSLDVRLEDDPRSGGAGAKRYVLIEDGDGEEDGRWRKWDGGRARDLERGRAFHSRSERTRTTAGAGKSTS